MNVRDVCSRNLASVPVSASLSEVAMLMRDRRVGAVVVLKGPVSDPVAAGIVTDRDIVRAQLERASDLSSICVADVMTADPLIVCEDDAVDDVIERMREFRVRRAPVVTTRGTVCGLISTDDLVSEIARELAGLARLVERQPKLEHF